MDILAPFCQELCFGAETADKMRLMGTAQVLLSEDFSAALREYLDQGLSFPAARQQALARLGGEAEILGTPNNILAVEYCKAILAGGYTLEPAVIARQGSYHDMVADSQNPSATALRERMHAGQAWLDFVPEEAKDCFRDQPVHAIKYGQLAILSRLRRMTEQEFAALPYGSEGLWRKLMHSVRNQATLENILTQTKSKRYTRSRLDRMVMCAFLEITEVQLQTPVPYTRVLAFNDTGRQILKNAREHGDYVNLGQRMDDPWQTLEDRCGDLYGLFAKAPEPPGRNENDRVYYHKV